MSDSHEPRKMFGWDCGFATTRRYYMLHSDTSTIFIIWWWKEGAECRGCATVWQKKLKQRVKQIESFPQFEHFISNLNIDYEVCAKISETESMSLNEIRRKINVSFVFKYASVILYSNMNLFRGKISCVFVCNVWHPEIDFFFQEKTLTYSFVEFFLIPMKTKRTTTTIICRFSELKSHMYKFTLSHISSET